VAISLTDLLKGATRDALLEQAILFLRMQGFPLTGWQPGNALRTLVETYVELKSELLRVVQVLGTGGFLDYADGPTTAEGDGWIDLLLRELFDLERKPATFAIHSVVMQDVGGVGPVSVVAGQVVALGPSGLEFVSYADATIPLNGSAVVPFQSRSPGAVYNVPINSITTLGTDLPGVAIGNPPIGTTGTSLIEAGLDRETPAEARVRAKARWARLGTGTTKASYTSVLLDSSNDIRRVSVLENTPTAGKVTCYVASPSGPAPALALAAAAAAVEQMRPLAVQVFVLNATPVTVTVSGTVLCRVGATGVAAAEVTSRLLAYQATLGLGDKLIRSRIIEEIMATEGVNNVSLTLPAGDITPTIGTVLVLDNQLFFGEGT
jgi:uncharacterized phage protein gp47/JayE